METPRPHTPCIPTMCTLMQDRSLRGVRGTPSTHHALDTRAPHISVAPQSRTRSERDVRI